MSDTLIDDCTFLQLFNGDQVSHIRIPIVQRDYAQGRPDVADKLDALLNDIKDAVDQSEALGLSFVYGKITDRIFVPMDGQQRLTLLFLLHVYVFQADDARSGLLKRFSYEARHTSKMFVEKLVDNRKAVFASPNKPSHEIKDSAWFLPQWEFDPTIKSMLAVLDKIREIFPDIEPLSKALQRNFITFKFLSMSDFGLEDSLYIKLNARGKPLTEFEVFRAKLIKQLQSLQKSGEFADLDGQFENGFVKSFEKHLDGDWTDVFWNLATKTRNNSPKGGGKENDEIAPLLDNLFLTFIDAVLKNHFLKKTDPHDKFIDSDELETDIRGRINELGGDAFVSLYFTLQTLRTDGLWDTFLSKCALGGTHTERLLLYALTVYADKTRERIPDKKDAWESHFDDWYNGFKKWYRVFKNLALNSDSIKKLRLSNMIKSVDREFSKIWNEPGKWNDIAEFLAGLPVTNSKNNPFTGFDVAQINEERLKARLILKRELPFEESIHKAEVNPYFSGQITGILNFAGFSNDDDGTSESGSVFAEKLQLFNRYVELLDELFDKTEPDKSGPKVDGFLLRQAMLAFTDQEIPLKYGTLIANTPNKYVKSWKDIMRDGEHPYRPCIEKLFKRLIEKDRSQDVETALKKIVASSSMDESDWRYYLIDKDDAPGIFNGVYHRVDEKFINTAFWIVRKHEGRILLYTTPTANGFYYDLDTLALYTLINHRKGFSDVSVSPDRQYRTADLAVKGITLPNGEKLRVKCSAQPRGLSVEREDGTALSNPFEGQTVDDVLKYLENAGYFNELAV